jgi:hypothetical protein
VTLHVAIATKPENSLYILSFLIERDAFLHLGMTSQALQLAEQTNPGTASNKYLVLNDSPLPEPTSPYTRLRLRYEPNAARRVRFARNGTEVPLKPVTLLQDPPTHLRYGLTYAQSAARARYSVDEVTLR